MPFEVKQISEREIWVGDCKLRLEDNDIIYNIAAKNPDKEQAIAITNAVYKLAAIPEGKVSVIIDLTDTGRPSPEARKVFSEWEKNEKIHKTAMIGAHPVARMLANFMISFLNTNKVAFLNQKRKQLSG